MIGRWRGGASSPDSGSRQHLHRHIRIGRVSRRSGWLLLAAVLTLLAAGHLPRARAQSQPTLRYVNPMRNGLTGKPLSCPDPSVTKVHRGKWNYFLFCTSDNGRNAFPIWMSEDLVHWYPDGFVFPHNHQPWWAVPSTGGGRAGIYWAPSVYRINDQWVMYFSADYNQATHAIRSVTLAPGTMVLGVATSHSLAGPWHTKLLHYPGPAQRPEHAAQPGGDRRRHRPGHRAGSPHRQEATSSGPSSASRSGSPSSRATG